MFDDTPIIHIEDDEGCAAIPVVRLVAFCLVAMTCGSALSFWAKGSSQITLTGEIKAPVHRIVSPQDAEITESPVAPGDEVAPGQLVFRLADRSLESRIAAKRIELSQLANKKDQIEARVELEVAWRERELSTEIYTAKLNSARLQQEQHIAEMQSLVWEDLLKQGENSLLAALDSEDFPSVLSSLQSTSNGIVSSMLRKGFAEDTSEEFDFQISLSDDRVQELEAANESLTTQIERAEGLPGIRERYEIAEQQLADLEDQFDELEVRSPTHGRVSGIFSDRSAVAKKNAVLMELVDLDQRFLEVAVPSMIVTQLSQGDEVDLTFAGNRQTVGTIQQISLMTNNTAGNIQSDDATVTVTIVPDGALWPIVPVGSRVQVRLAH